MWVTVAGYLAVAALARSFPTFLISMAVAGAGLTLAGPAAKVLVAQHVSTGAPRRRLRGAHVGHPAGPRCWPV